MEFRAQQVVVIDAVLFVRDAQRRGDVLRGEQGRDEQGTEKGCTRGHGDKEKAPIEASSIDAFQ